MLHNASYDLVKSQSREIGSLDYLITLKFDRHICNSAAEGLIKFQSN